ncbi:MAG: MarR family winged helix-turn-helix transcriptional regulator [Bacteriovoracaceae bacterium]|jgi:DNA-binding MarR family transcriptional regulator|nr:MarR family winged helix-turn-helix transcriptional regulator [Bacteriovoracaceae bacterium]
MMRISKVGILLKKIYRLYSSDLIGLLQQRGFLDLRPSFLEILNFVCDNQLPSIKEVGVACGLKKQTMTSHLNELEKRGYIIRKASGKDKREQIVHLTEYGQKFKIALNDSISFLENKYLGQLGEIELDRVVHSLENLEVKILNSSSDQKVLL